MQQQNEGLRAARGITLGLILSLAAWAVIASVILWLT